MSVSTSSFCAVTTTASIEAVGAGGGPSAARTIGHVAMARVYTPSPIAQDAERIGWAQPSRRFKTSRFLELKAGYRRAIRRAYAREISIMCHGDSPTTANVISQPTMG